MANQLIADLFVLLLAVAVAASFVTGVKVGSQ